MRRWGSSSAAGVVVEFVVLAEVSGEAAVGVVAIGVVV